MNNTTRLADCAQILIGKNIDKAKTNEKKERPKAIALIEKLSSLLREIEVTEATIEKHDIKYNKIKNRYLNL